MSTLNLSTDDILFQSAHAALLFAFNFSGQYYDRPLMNRLAARVTNAHAGKGLYGLDGAAQAGMIRAEVATLGKLAESLLIARLAARATPCACRALCCSGKKPNPEWVQAIAHLADHVRHTALAGCTSDGLLRRAYVLRYFAPKRDRVHIDDLADQYNKTRQTVSGHCKKVANFLKDLESKAEQRVTEQLKNAGLIE